MFNFAFWRTIKTKSIQFEAISIADIKSDIEGYTG